MASDPDRAPLHARAGSVVTLDLAGKPPFEGSTKAIGRLFARLIGDGRFHVRVLSTTLPFAKLATGDVAGAMLIGNGPADPLHTAAGCLLAQSAGALVTDEAGNPWTLNSRTLIAAVPELHAFLLECVAESFSG